MEFRLLNDTVAPGGLVITVNENQSTPVDVEFLQFLVFLILGAKWSAERFWSGLDGAYDGFCSGTFPFHILFLSHYRDGLV